MDTVKPKLPFFELMATQACNLSCHGCTNYADLPHKGYVKWKDVHQYLSNWTNRVEITDLGILGGEPLMNPEIEKWLYGIRELLPDAQIRFTTNGLLLEKKFHIVKVLEDIGNVVFKISKHFDNNKKLDRIIQRVFDSYDWQPIHEFGIDRYVTGNKFRFYTRQTKTFIKTYKGPYENMQPYNSNPADAIDICCQRYCPLMYNGQLYKCSTSALLKDTLNKVGNPNYTEWEPYIVDGLSFDCTDEDLAGFMHSFGKSEKICGMCPTKNDHQSKVIHLENVSRKKYAIQNAN